MNAYSQLDHVLRCFADQLGSRAADYLSVSCQKHTAESRLVLACAALKAVGVADVPAAEGDWLEAGRGLVKAELHSLTVGTPRIISPDQEATVRRKMATTLTPDGLLNLLVNTWEAGRRTSVLAAAARRDGLKWPLESTHQRRQVA